MDSCAITGAPDTAYKIFRCAARECISAKSSYRLSPADGSLHEAPCAYLFLHCLFISFYHVFLLLSRAKLYFSSPVGKVHPSKRIDF